MRKFVGGAGDLVEVTGVGERSRHRLGGAGHAGCLEHVAVGVVLVAGDAAQRVGHCFHQVGQRVAHEGGDLLLGQSDRLGDRGGIAAGVEVVAGDLLALVGDVGAPRRACAIERVVEDIGGAVGVGLRLDPVNYVIVDDTADTLRKLGAQFESAGGQANAFTPTLIRVFFDTNFKLKTEITISMNRLDESQAEMMVLECKNLTRWLPRKTLIFPHQDIGRI